MIEEQVKQLFDTTQLTIDEIVDEVHSTYKIVWNIIKRSYSKEDRNRRKKINYSRSKLGSKNPQFGKLREEHPNFKGEVGDGNGYIMVLKPEWYTGRIGSKHVFKHTIVICEALNLTELPKGFIIHHIDRNRTNNALNNLALMTNGAHARLHQRDRATTSLNDVG